MRESTIARNYAETLLALAGKANDTAGWGRMIEQVAQAMRDEGTLRAFLAAPQVSDEQKNLILSRAFQDRMPRLFVRYLQALVKNRRQLLIPAIAESYHQLVDEREGRVHARVTYPNAVPEAEVQQLAATLGERIGAEVIPHVTVDERLLGGVVVRIGDRVYDGSVQRRVEMLRRRMHAAFD